MHSLLIQCLIATIDKEFSPEEHKQLLDEQKTVCSFEEWTAYWDIAKHIPAQRDALREKLGHPAPKYQQRQMVKEVLSNEAAKAIEPRLPVVQHSEDETPVDWQPRIHAKMDFS
jgi:hypothetical protein